MFKKSQCFKSYSKQELGLISAYVNTSIQLASKNTTRLLKHTTVHPRYYDLKKFLRLCHIIEKVILKKSILF